MNAVIAEVRKLFSSRALVWLSVATVALPLLLVWVNGAGARDDLARGRADLVTEDLSIVGSGELLLPAACVAAIGVLLVGAEHVRTPEELGGGRQAVTTALAIPSRYRVIGAKLLVAVVWVGLLSVLAAFGALLVAHMALGPYAVTLDATRWAVGARGAAYLTLNALLGFAVTVVLRDGLIPLVYLVANSTIVSPGYLLTHVTEWAWFLPDTAAMAILRMPPEPSQPAAWVAALVAIAWVLGSLGVGIALESRREA